MSLKPARDVFKLEKYKKPSEALSKALSILRKPGRWITGELAVKFNEDDYREVCSTKAKDAVAFCALGVVKFINGPAQKSAEAFLREAGKVIRGKEGSSYKATDDDIFYVNDMIGFLDTINMFKLAIKNARKAGK